MPLIRTAYWHPASMGYKNKTNNSVKTGRGIYAINTNIPIIQKRNGNTATSKIGARSFKTTDYDGSMQFLERRQFVDGRFCVFIQSLRFFI